jgi:hypothetical protein
VENPGLSLKSYHLGAQVGIPLNHFPPVAIGSSAPDFRFIINDGMPKAFHLHGARLANPTGLKVLELGITIRVPEKL